MTASSGRSRSAERPVERVGLRHRAGEAVEQEAAAAPSAREALADHPDHHGVGHQLARVHVALGLAAEVGARGDGRAQQVAGGEVHEVELGAQALGLRALAGPGGPEEDQARYFRNPSYERIISCASIWRMVSSATPTTIRIDVPPRTPKNTFESGR